MTPDEDGESDTESETALSVSAPSTTSTTTSGLTLPEASRGTSNTSTPPINTPPLLFLQDPGLIYGGSVVRKPCFAPPPADCHYGIAGWVGEGRWTHATDATDTSASEETNNGPSSLAANTSSSEPEAKRQKVKGKGKAEDAAQPTPSLPDTANGCASPTSWIPPISHEDWDEYVAF